MGVGELNWDIKVWVGRYRTMVQGLRMRAGFERVAVG
jgi:hypothetical protein